MGHLGCMPTTSSPVHLSHRYAGLDTGIHGSVAERAAAARAVMLQRDREDKAALRELRKQQRQEKRVGGGAGLRGLAVCRVAAVPETGLAGLKGGRPCASCTLLRWPDSPTPGLPPAL